MWAMDFFDLAAWAAFRTFLRADSLCLFVAIGSTPFWLPAHAAHFMTSACTRHLPAQTLCQLWSPQSRSEYVRAGFVQNG
jgi:hypothetical protein